MDNSTDIRLYIAQLYKIQDHVQMDLDNNVVTFQRIGRYSRMLEHCLDFAAVAINAALGSKADQSIIDFHVKKLVATYRALAGPSHTLVDALHSHEQQQLQQALVVFDEAVNCFGESIIDCLDVSES